MPTPSIQTLTTDAQQVLNLDSISAVRSVVAVALANANTGTPLNPNLTTQQLWNEFYQVVTKPKSDIESIIANQLMKFLYAPPAPGGVGANKQVIFNDGGVLAGDADFQWDKTANLLTVTGAATITGDLTVNSNVNVGASPAFYGGKIATNGSIAIAGGNYLKLWNSTGTGVAGINAGAADTLTFSLTNAFTTAMTLNSTGLGVGVSPSAKLDVRQIAAAEGLKVYVNDTGATNIINFRSYDNTLGEVTRYAVACNGVATWSNVGGVAGTAMTLNSTGLGVGVVPAAGDGSGVFKAAGTGSGATNTRLGLDVREITSGNAAGIWLGAMNNENTGVIGSRTASGNIAFQTFNGASWGERMRIDYLGNVGIGVTPSAWGAGIKGLELGSLGSGISSGGTFGGSLYATMNAYNDGSWKFARNAAAGLYGLNSDKSFAWYQSSNAPSVGGAITWTQAMTLTAAGDFLTGGKTAASVTAIGFQTLANGESSTAMASSTGSASVWNAYSTGAGAYRFYVAMNGTISATNTTISAISDARLKENVQDIDVGLGAILALKPRKFDWKAGKGKDIKGDRGFIAQEFEQVFPNLIDEWKDPAPEGEAPYKSVRQDLIPVLVKAIQELAAEVNALKNA